MLIEIKWKEDESLRKFISRFIIATLKVSDQDPMVTMLAMKDGLKPSRFFFSLEKQFPASFVEMLSRAEKYTNAEEAMSARRNSAPNPSDKKEKEKEKRKREEPSSNDRSSQVRGSVKPPSPKFHNYAPLNTSQSEILMEIKDQLFPPRRMFTPPIRRNPNKYYRYHQDHSHDTDECLQLMDEIELVTPQPP